jgi:hypothetical protein
MKECAAESVTWAILVGTVGRRMVTEGGACFAGHPKGWIPLQGFLRPIRTYAAEPLSKKYSVQILSSNMRSLNAQSVSQGRTLPYILMNDWRIPIKTSNKEGRHTEHQHQIETQSTGRKPCINQPKSTVSE